MPNWYPTKTVSLNFEGQRVEKVVAADLDRVYVTDREGELSVYYDSNKVIDNKHVFVIGKKDNFVNNAESSLYTKGRKHG